MLAAGLGDREPTDPHHDYGARDANTSTHHRRTGRRADFGESQARWSVDKFHVSLAYVDILNFFTPGVVEDILGGRVFEFDLSQTFSTAALTLVAIPIFMVVVSMTLPARVNRMTNLIVALLYVPVTVFNVVGASWLLFYGLGIVLELILLALIVRFAWTWPRTAPSVTAPTRSGREALEMT